MSRKKAEWHGCRECGCKHNGECDEQLAAKDAEIEAMCNSTKTLQREYDAECIARDKAERERDEARAEIVNQRRQHQDARSEFSRIYDLCSAVQEQRDAAEASVKKLTEAIEKAPHGQDCGYDSAWKFENHKRINIGTCNCWKAATIAAAALEEEK